MADSLAGEAVLQVDSKDLEPYLLFRIVPLFLLEVRINILALAGNTFFHEAFHRLKHLDRSYPLCFLRRLATSLIFVHYAVYSDGA